MGYPEISQWPLDFITRFHAHVLMNAFTFAFAYDMFGIFFVRFAEINQWSLDLITRNHVHVRYLLLRGRDKDRDRQTIRDR